MAGRAKGSYRVLVGINYGPTGRRAEPGDTVDDLPAGDVPWMLAQGVIADTAPVAPRDPKNTGGE